MKSRLLVCVIILLAIAIPGFAATVHVVPQMYPTIAEAVAACADGDVVVVQRISANGGNPYTVTGPGGISPTVANLTIRSYNPKDPSCIADTIIDCRNSSRAFTFADNQPCNVIIEGFTIINGYATGPVGAVGDINNVDPMNPDPEAWSGEDVQGNGYGGAVYIGSGAAPVIRNCVFQNSHVYGAVGGVGAPGFYIYTMDPNNPDEITIEGVYPGGQGGDGDGSGLGGAIYCGDASTPTIVDCIFSNNFAHGGIGGMGGEGHLAIPALEIQATDGGDGGDGIGDGQGGAIYADQSSDPNIVGCTIRNNTVTVGVAGQGGQAGNSTLDPENPASDGSQGNVITSNLGFGGAVYYNTGILNNITSSLFQYNDAGDQGGAIYCAASGLLNINNGCEFNHNEALNGSGGAICAESGCILTIDNSRFLQNTAILHGGAVFADIGSEIHASKSSFSANTAGIDDGTNFVWGNGGAIDLVNGMVLDVNSCSFGMNDASGRGGAICVIGTLQYCGISMKSTSVISNEALRGGGVYFGRFRPVDPLNNDVIVDCTFISNISEDAGGGLYLTNNLPHIGSRILNCDITDNSVFDDAACGGGVYANGIASTFENCRILRNSSTWSGGGLYFIGLAQTDVKNCLFVDNSAGNDGSAISSNFNINNSLMHFTNNTFAQNTITGFTGEGGAVYNNGDCNPIISDCIFYHCNKVAVYETDETSLSTLNNNLFYSNVNGDYRLYNLGGGTVYSGAVSINSLPNANANLDGNPMFVSGDLGDYYLSQIAAGQMQNSPAVDSGSTTAVLAGLNTYTTRTDSLTNPTEAGDAGVVDLGYHSPKTADMPKYHLDIQIVNPYGTVTTIPEMENNDFYSGTVVRLVAAPNFSYRVAYWQGTESDSSTELTNTVIMSSDKTVRIEFETPKVLKVKSDGGSDYYSDIRDALFSAQDGDVIEVYKGVYRGPVIELYKNVCIRSRNPNDPSYVADTIIDRGGYRERAFYISNIIDNTTLIHGLTMINAGWIWGNGGTPLNAGFNGGDGPSFEGGAIYIDAGASPVIKDCIIRDNYGQAGGGGRGHDADATFNAGRGGWGGWSRGGAVYCGTGSAPQFINCKFQNNRAIGGSGGDGGNWDPTSGNLANYGGNWSTFMSPAFFNVDPRVTVLATLMDAGNFDITRELWDKWNELAQQPGGTGLWSGYYIDEIDIDGYYGDYKWYGGYGGAVYCGMYSNVNFVNCEITGNTAVSGMSGLGGWYGGKRFEPQISYELPSFGAGVYCDRNSNTLFEGCTISNNVASQMQGRYRLNPIVSHGGGVCSEDTASVIFRNCHIGGNQADIGGGIHFADSNPIIEDSNIVDNVAMQGGGIYGDHGTADIIGCNILRNESRTLTDPNLTFKIDGSGGGIHISSLDINIIDCFISENLAEYSGGGLFFDGDHFQTVFNCLITDNMAGHDGGGIAITTWSDPTISNCTIVGNRIVPIFELEGTSAGVEGMELPGPTTYGDKLTQAELNQIEMLYSDSPPVRPDSVAMFIQAQPVSADGDIVLADVPTSTWTYGCAATSAGMLFGYYDRIGYENMYTGPTNGGVVPLTNVGQGDNPANPIAGACSIIATQKGFDGRTINGHVDDYWISYGSEGPDPWETSGTEHKWGSCTADYMGTNQWKWDGDGDNTKDWNSDGSTVWFNNGAAKHYDFIPPSSFGMPQTALCHGMRLFAESRGYIVTENYNQMVDAYITGGFSFAEYKAEIDAGCPVLIHVTGHTMTGVGYNNLTQEIILHDTWDNQKHRMAWGGYYGDLRHLGVTVIHIESDPSAYGAGIDVSNGGSANIINSIIWDNSGYQMAVGVEEEPASIYVSYSNIGPGESPVYVSKNSFIQGWDPNTYPDSNGWAPNTHNINQDPLFISDYMLTQISAGQLEDSPCVDTGSDLASTLGFDGYTTRTDSGPDEGIVDMGYHHPMFETELMELNFLAVTDPDLGVAPVIDPFGITYHTQYTTVELTASDPPTNYQVNWNGSDDDTLTGTTNTVHMNTDKTVVVRFVKNYCILNVSVDGQNGSFKVSPAPGAGGVYPRGTLVTITALPDAGYRVKKWTGTMDDTSVELVNQVLMDGDKTVTIAFETPGIISVPGGAAGSLQQAIDQARELDTIILASGTYRVQEGFSISGKNITIASSSPDDPNCVAGTIIEQLHVEGGSHDRAFTFWNVGPETVLNGLTIRNFRIRTTDGDDGGTDPNTFRNMCGRNSGTNAGVAILCYKASPTIKNCRFVNCNTIGGNGGNGAAGIDEQPNGGMGGWPGGAHGGAVAMYPYWDSDGFNFGPSNPTFINCQFIDNSAQGGNGGNGGDGLTDDENGIYGDAGLGGGWYYGLPGSYYYGTRVYWPFGYHFDGRNFDGQYDEYTRYSGLGGAVFVGPGCSPVFKGCNFQGNRSYGGFCGINGLNGGVDLRMAPAAPWKIDSLGGAVYCDTNSMPYFYDCNFFDNEADVNIPSANDKPFISFGGAVAARDNAKPVFSNCSFSNNSAAIGGALYGCVTQAKVIDCNVVNNSAFHGGGVYYADSDCLVDNSTITYNFTTQIQDPNIFPDEIFGLGGGMSISACNADIVDCNISMNSAGASGGGIYFSDSDSALKNCLITSNYAERDGAGVSVNWLSDLNVSNCTVAYNLISGINFQAPYNYGGGLYCGYGSYTSIINSIFWNNTASSGHQLAVAAEKDGNTSGSVLDVAYSTVLGGKSSIFVADKCTVNWDDATNKYVDPFFVSGVRGDYFLSHADIDDPNQIEDSPAIDAGSTSSSEAGLQGYTTRTDGYYDYDVVDMGYHYPVGGQCQICDLDRSGKVEFGDLAILAQYWLYADTQCNAANNWCQGANIVPDAQINFKDYSKIADCWMVTASGMKAIWLVEPYTKTRTSISMTAKTVINNWGWDVEYYFECLNDGNVSSGWQKKTEYVATNLVPETQYNFRFKVRDLSPNLTESEWSVVRSALTGEDVGDITPPTPNPMTWEIQPTPTSPTTVTMRANLATDDVVGTLIQYRFFSADTNGTSSNWQYERDYTDTNAEPNSICTYYVIAKDMSSNQNQTLPSVSISVQTPPEGVIVDNQAPLPNPSEWTTRPYENSGFHIMQAVVASDASTGGNDPVWYYFKVVNGYGTDSGWRRGDLDYTVPGYGTAPGYMYVYQHTGNVAYTVKTCDTIPGSNPPQPNTAATNTTTPSEPAATYLP